MLVARRKGTKTKVPIEETARSLGSSKGLLQVSAGARGVWFLLFEDGQVPMNDQPLTTIVHSEKAGGYNGLWSPLRRSLPFLVNSRGSSIFE